MKYEKPLVVELGSIARNTWGEGQTPRKSLEDDPWHYDRYCEMSGGTDLDYSGCGS